MKLLICDKTAPDAIRAMRQAGIEVDERLDTMPDTLLATVPGYDAMVVRSSTKVTPAVIDAGTDLKLIIRAGVGLDNIDVAYAQSAGIVVRNTPQASADSVGELVIGRFSGVSVESIRFAFEVLSPETRMEGAKLDVEEPKAVCACQTCGRRSQIEDLAPECPACGDDKITIEGGQEMILKSIELEE